MLYRNQSRCSVAVCVALLVICGAIPVAAQTKVFAGGREIALKTPITRQGGKTLVPMEVVKALSAKAVVSVRAGETRALVTTFNRASVILPVEVVGRKPMVSLREVTRRLGVTAQWDKDGDSLSLLGEIRAITFDGKTLRVTTSIPVKATLVKSDWVKSIGHAVLDFQGAVFPIPSEMKISAPESLPVTTGMQADGTARVVARLPAGAAIRGLTYPARAQYAVATSGVAVAVRKKREPDAGPAVTAKPPQARPKVTGVQYRKDGPRAIEVRVTADAQTKYSVKKLSAPARVVMDIHETELAKPLRKLNLDGRIARSVNVEPGRDHSVRVTVTLATDCAVDASWNGAGVYALTLRRQRTGGESIAGKVVVIDPGHGGYKPGCVGCSDVVEKTVTLQIAQRLQRALTSMGANVTLTRSGDTHVENTARADLAGRIGADILISIHCNAADGTTGKAQGIETYYHVNDSPAKDLASSVQGAIVDSVPSPDRGIKVDTETREASNAVLHRSSSLGIPACLVEVGFLDNEEDAERLSDADCQEALAAAIAKGAKAFFTGKPLQTRTSRSRGSSRRARSRTAVGSLPPLGRT